MYLHISDTRQPLQAGDVVETSTHGQIIVDKYIGAGGFSLMYLAHVQGSSRFLALKELYPRQVENAVILRRADGRIAICDPVSGPDTAENHQLWQELKQYFHKEAELTSQAGSVFNQDGSKAQQNNPDVLHVEGPFEDSRGNTYLAIDTYQGEPLRDFIERGFIRNEDGCIVSNEFLEDILDILTETAIRLSDLHSSGLWHLDLSPDNIYIVPSAGRTRLSPYIIDYGSAYNRNNPAEPGAHRYTCNPFSPPEVLALSALQNAACGYAPDESSDTYALVAILFYAVTGQVFNAEQRMGSAVWKDLIRREHAAGLPAHQGADSFAGRLIALLDQGLAASQRNRFPTATDLCNHLKQLKTAYREYGNLLPLVDRDELMSYMVLEKYPLYQYKGSDGHIHVLCLGSGVFVKRMILSLISCGQMAGSRLYIHVVSDQPEEHLKEYLCDTAPALKDYSNLAGPVENEYVTFSYDHVTDVLDETVCRNILNRYSDARYLLVSLGKNAANARAVALYARCMKERPNPENLKAIINYYCSEDAANNIHAVLNDALPPWLEAAAFGDNLASYSKTIRVLGLRTLKLAHLYKKLSNPNISLAETARELSAKEYDQRSSCAAALHLKYKLASVGINPAPTTTKRAIISAYQKVLAGAGANTLLALEHRRWMMYMIADGYRCPTLEDLWEFGFERVNGQFNSAWKCTQMRLHPCLVPCSKDGIVLKNEHWQTYNSLDRIKKAPFDDLDKVSLTLHVLAGKKCQRILGDKSIANCFLRISSKLKEARTEGNQNPRPYDVLDKSLKNVRETITLAAEALEYKGDHGLLTQLQQDFSNLGINIADEVQSLRKYLSVFAEYASNKDYKASDATIIRNLLWLLYADNDITFIKLSGRTIADSITGPLILEPHRLIFFGEPPRPEWERFLRVHGNMGDISFHPHGAGTVPEICTALKQIVTRRRGRYVIDITGAGEQMVIAAQRIADAHTQVSLIRCTPDGTVENIHGFVTAPAYTLNTTISANEIFSLYGAQENPSSIRYMEQLGDLVPMMWQFYQEFRKDWTLVSAFFASWGGGCPELRVYNVQVKPDTVWKSYTRKIDEAKWNRLELAAVFGKLADAGILQDLSWNKDIPGRICLSFLYPGSDFFRNALDLFFTRKIVPVFVPMRCDIKRHPQGSFTIEIRSGCQVEVFEQKGVEFADKRYPGSKQRFRYASVVPALKRLEALGLIADLEIPGSLDTAPVSIRFIYANPAVKDCLAVAGNVLELHIWREAKRTHFFDNVQANFSFTWKEGISNELDVILTKGLTSLIVSAKTSRFNKEHLYEIKYMTERFCLNSKPVIVYSSDQAIEDGRATDNLLPVKNRARAMGIYLIDLNTPGTDLGKILVDIACGAVNP